MIDDPKMIVNNINSNSKWNDYHSKQEIICIGSSTDAIIIRKRVLVVEYPTLQYDYWLEEQK